MHMWNEWALLMQAHSNKINSSLIMMPSGNLSGLGVQNPRPWEISWASGSVFSDTSLLSAVYGFNTNFSVFTFNISSKLYHVRMKMCISKFSTKRFADKVGIKDGRKHCLPSHPSPPIFRAHWEVLSKFGFWPFWKAYLDFIHTF